MIDRFGDLAGGGFYFTGRSSPDLLVRQKAAIDSPLPSGNAVAASVLVSLGQLESARTFAATVLLFALAVLLYGAFALAERRFVDWKPS